MADGASSGRHRYLALDGLRGVAAGMVLVGHIGAVTHRDSYFGHSYLAVDLFFVLSGFVLAGAYERRLAVSPSPTFEMLRIRLIRLWPVMALGSLIGLAVAPIQTPELKGLSLVGAFAHQLTFLPILRPDTNLFLLNGVEWSLFFEVAINLVHALILRRLGSRALLVLMIASGGLLTVLTIRAGHLNIGWSYETFWGGVARVSFSYAAGVLLFRSKDVLPKLRIPAVLFFAGPLIGLAPTRLGLPVLADLANVFLLFPLLVWAGAYLQLGARLSAMSDLAGELSYPVYAIHAPILAAWEALVIHHLGQPAAKAAAWLMVIPIVALISLAVSRWYDVPMRAMLTRALGKRSTVGPAAASSPG